MDDAAMENISFESLPNKRQKIIDNDCNMDNNTNNDWDTMSLNGCNNWPIFHYNYNPNTGLYQPLDGQSVYDNDLNSTTANTTALNTLF